MKSTFVALSPELLLCSATGKDNLADITGEDFVRLLSGPRIGPDKPQPVTAELLIAGKIIEGLRNSRGIEKALEIAPNEAHFLLGVAYPMRMDLEAIEEKLRTARSGTVQRKKSTS